MIHALTDAQITTIATHNRALAASGFGLCIASSWYLSILKAATSCLQYDSPSATIKFDGAAICFSNATTAIPLAAAYIRYTTTVVVEVVIRNDLSCTKCPLP